MTEPREILFDFVELWRRHAEKRAASLDATEEEKQALAENTLLLDSVNSLIQIIDDYGKLVRLTWPSPMAPENLVMKNTAEFGGLGLGPFIPGGLTYLTGVLFAAFSIGGLMPKDSIIRKQMLKLVSTGLEKARDGKRHKRDEDPKELLFRDLYEHGVPVGAMSQVLKANKKSIKRKIATRIKAGVFVERTTEIPVVHKIIGTL